MKILLVGFWLPHAYIYIYSYLTKGVHVSTPCWTEKEQVGFCANVVLNFMLATIKEVVVFVDKF